jgi:hypothetical protein
MRNLTRARRPPFLHSLCLLVAVFGKVAEIVSFDLSKARGTILMLLVHSIETVTDLQNKTHE